MPPFREETQPPAAAVRVRQEHRDPLGHQQTDQPGIPIFMGKVPAASHNQHHYLQIIFPSLGQWGL